MRFGVINVISALFCFDYDIELRNCLYLLLLRMRAKKVTEMCALSFANLWQLKLRVWPITSEKKCLKQDVNHVASNYRNESRKKTSSISHSKNTHS